MIDRNKIVPGAVLKLVFKLVSSDYKSLLISEHSLGMHVKKISEFGEHFLINATRILQCDQAWNIA